MSDKVTRRLQVLLLAQPGAPAVAGLPCAVRAAYRAGRDLSPERIVIAGADQAYLDRWSFQFHAAGVPVVSDRFGAGSLDPRLPILAVDVDAFPDAGGLKDFYASAAPLEGVRRTLQGRTVAAFVRDGAALGAGTSAPADVYARALSSPRAESSDGAFFDAHRPADAAAAAAALYARMAKPNDGYLARFDRRLSVAITRLLLPFPISPNQVTAASLLLGFLGAWWLASGSARTQFEGALLLWFCALLDGCDGEIARLKHHITSWGGEFDLLADHIAHLVTFIALPIGVARLHPDQDWWIPGVLLVTGFLAAGFSVWWLVLRVPEDERGPSALVIERIASRDYVYLIVALTLVGRLDWFVWTAAYGTHVFWMWLWWTARRVKAPIPSPSASRALLPPNLPS
jgi:phosphatidylglycerophosphate synthase